MIKKRTYICREVRLDIRVPDCIISQIKPKQIFMSAYIESKILIYSTKISYRGLADILVDITNFDDFKYLPVKTLEELVLRQGKSIETQDKEAPIKILKAHKFNPYTLTYEGDNNTDIVCNSFNIVNTSDELINKINLSREENEKIDTSKIIEIEESL